MTAIDGVVRRRVGRPAFDRFRLTGRPQNWAIVPPQGTMVGLNCRWSPVPAATALDTMAGAHGRSILFSSGRRRRGD